MRKLLGLMTVLTTGAIISVGCGTSSSSDTTTAQQQQEQQPEQGQQIQEKATIEGDATSIKKYIDFLDADLKANDQPVIKDVVARVKTSNGNIYCVDGYFFKKKEGEITKLYFAIPNVPLNAEVSIQFVNEKYENPGKPVNVTPEKVVASTPDIKVNSPKVEIKIEKFDPTKKIAIVKTENETVALKVFELLNTTIDKTQNINSNFEYVGNINVEGDEVHLYWNDGDNKLLALDVTKPKASVIVDSNDIADLGKVKEINIKDGKVYVMMKDTTNTESTVGEITVSKSSKISVSLLTSSDKKVNDVYNVYVFKDDGMYALKDSLARVPRNLTIADSTAPQELDPLSNIKLVKWDYNFNKIEKNKYTKLNADFNYDTDANGNVVKVGLTIDLLDSNDNSYNINICAANVYDSQVSGAVKLDSTAISATVTLKDIGLSTQDPKDIYENKSKVYVLMDVSLSADAKGSNDSNAGTAASKAAVILAYNPLDPSNFVHDKVSLDTNSNIQSADFKGNVLAFADSSAAYVCNLDLDSNLCQEVYTSTTEKIAWIKVLNRKGNDVYLIIKDSNGNNNINYLIKYDLSSQNAEVEGKASGNVIANAPTFIKVTDDNQDVMLVKDSTANTYYLIDYNEKSIKKTGNFPTDCGEDDLLNITSKGAALLYDKANQKVCYGSLKAGVYELYDGVSLRSYKFNLKTGDVTLLLENTASLYYEVCTFSSLDCSKSSTLTFIESNSKFIGKVGNKYKYISYESSDNYTDVYIYKLIADDAKATINVDSFKYQNATGYKFEDVIKLDLDVLVKDPSYYYLFKERNN